MNLVIFSEFDSNLIDACLKIQSNGCRAGGRKKWHVV